MLGRECTLDADFKTLVYESTTLEFWLYVYFFLFCFSSDVRGGSGCDLPSLHLFVFKIEDLSWLCRLELEVNIPFGWRYRVKYSGIVPYLWLVYVNVAGLVPSVFMSRRKGEIGEHFSFSLVQFLSSLRDNSLHCVSLVSLL